MSYRRHYIRKGVAKERSMVLVISNLLIITMFYASCSSIINGPSFVKFIYVRTVLRALS